MKDVFIAGDNSIPQTIAPEIAYMVQALEEDGLLQIKCTFITQPFEGMEQVVVCFRQYGNSSYNQTFVDLYMSHFTYEPSEGWQGKAPFRLIPAVFPGAELPEELQRLNIGYADFRVSLKYGIMKLTCGLGFTVIPSPPPRY